MSSEYQPTFVGLDNRKKTEIIEYKLEARIRSNHDQGSRKSRALRLQGLVPGVIFGNNAIDSSGGKLAPHNNRILITTSHESLIRELMVNKVPGGTAMESRVYDMTMMDDHSPPEGPQVKAGDVVKVIPRHLEMHPVYNEVVCLNFLRYWPGRVLKVPLRYQNTEESAALKRGAFILAQNRFVEVTVEEGGDIPEYVEVNCKDLGLKDVVRRDRLVLPRGCEWGRKVGVEWLVGTVFGRAKSMEGVE